MKGILVFTLLATALLVSSCKKDPQVSENMSETFYVRVDDADMPVFVRGNGSSNVFILILHGGPGGNGLEYRGGTYSEMLESKYAMVYWDQRHQGNSHGSMPMADITVDKMVDDTYAVIKTLKARYGENISVFLMGHSWGGTLGTAYMIKNDYQSELKGWIEVDGAHDIPRLNIELIEMIQTIGAQEIAAGNNNDQWQEMIDYVNGIDTNNITGDNSSQLNSFGHRAEGLLSQIKDGGGSSNGIMNTIFFSPNNIVTGGQTGWQLPTTFWNEVEATALTSRLNEITIPTLLQWGRYDFVVPPALGFSAYDNIGSTNKYLKIYEHSGHSPMNNEPELFAQDVIDFVEVYK